MILYYALGGGLGHISRSLAILERAPAHLRDSCRLLVSSRSAGVVLPHAPCPVDRVPSAVMEKKQDYFSFFSSYLEMHRFTAVVIDTFPFGLLGELGWQGGDLPRVLVGRYLRWAPYAEMYGNTGNARWPDEVIFLEEQEENYRQELEHRARAQHVAGPVSLLPQGKVFPAAAKRCCVFHSGDAGELAILVEKGRRVVRELGMEGEPDLVVPSQGLYPVERHLGGYSDVVAGAGYAACAMAFHAKGAVNFHLHPFPRRYDDQALRLQRFQGGLWGTGENPGDEAALAVWAGVESCLR